MGKNGKGKGECPDGMGLWCPAKSPLVSSELPAAVPAHPRLELEQIGAILCAHAKQTRGTRDKVPPGICPADYIQDFRAPNARKAHAGEGRHPSPRLHSDEISLDTLSRVAYHSKDLTLQTRGWHPVLAREWRRWLRAVRASFPPGCRRLELGRPAPDSGWVTRPRARQGQD
eukprot:scaffold22156_cov148-Isochrysis_galbana.AAC.2